MSGFDTSGLRRLEADIAEAEPRNMARLPDTVRQEARDLVGDIRRSIVTVGAVDTGALHDGVSADIGAFRAEVGPTEDYAEYVNDGTSDTPPHRFMEPAIERSGPRFGRAVLDVGADIL